LAISIHEYADIKRIKIGNQETKLLQYADDTIAVLSNKNSAEVLFEELDVFKEN